MLLSECCCFSLMCVCVMLYYCILSCHCYDRLERKHHKNSMFQPLVHSAGDLNCCTEDIVSCILSLPISPVQKNIQI